MTIVQSTRNGVPLQRMCAMGDAFLGQMCLSGCVRARGTAQIKRPGLAETPAINVLRAMDKVTGRDR